MIYNEISALAICNHPNVLKLYEVYMDKEFCHLVTELCTGHELFDMLKREHRFSEKKTLNVTSQILLGLQHMHEKGYAHRAISTENVMFLNEDALVVKIISLGSSCKITGEPFTRKYGSALYGTGDNRWKLHGAL
jgi:calcium-dependent protein kinase